MLPTLLKFIALSSIRRRLTLCLTITRLLNPLVLSRHWAWSSRILAYKKSLFVLLLSSSSSWWWSSSLHRQHHHHHHHHHYRATCDTDAYFAVRRLWCDVSIWYWLLKAAENMRHGGEVAQMIGLAYPITWATLKAVEHDCHGIQPAKYHFLFVSQDKWYQHIRHVQYRHR